MYFLLFNDVWLQDTILKYNLEVSKNLFWSTYPSTRLTNLTKYKTKLVKRTHGHLKTWQFKRLFSKWIYQMLLRPKRQVSVRLRYTITFRKNGWFMIKRIFPFVRILRLKKLHHYYCLAKPALLLHIFYSRASKVLDICNFLSVVCKCALH